MEILDNGIWVGKDAGNHHQFDNVLASAISILLKENNIKNVIDIGCGLGLYTKTLLDNGINCDGFDGNPYTPQLTNNLCRVLNISEKVDYDKNYDAVLCLEVGEHIPKDKQDIFIKNLIDTHAKLIILSWAVPNQGGDGHVNELTNDKVIEIMNSKNYGLDYHSTLFLRNSISNCWWFGISLLVFRN